MVSEALRDELPLLVAATASLSAGIAAAIGIRSVVNRGDGHGPRRSVFAMVAASFGLALGAWFFVLAARIGFVTPRAPYYAAAGFISGILAGLFPLALGIPLFLAAAAAMAVGVTALAPMTAWADGARIARVTVFSTSATSTDCEARFIASGNLEGVRNLALPPGPVSLELGIVDIEGPFSACFGRRRFRIAAIVAGGTRTPLGAEAGLSRPATTFLRLVGCRGGIATSGEFTPEEMLSASFTLAADGSIQLTLR